MHFLEAEHLGFVHTQCFYFYPPLIMSLRSTLVLLCQKLQPRKLWLCVCVGMLCVQCYYSYLTKFTLSSKSAGWHNICIYIYVCVCAFVCACVCVHACLCVSLWTTWPPLHLFPGPTAFITISILHTAAVCPHTEAYTGQKTDTHRGTA